MSTRRTDQHSLGPASVETTQVRRSRIGSKSFLDRVDESMYEIVATGGHKKTPRVTVIVPTRNRCELTSQLLEALAKQDLLTDAYEIVVVDNASDDGTTELLKETARKTRVRFTGVRMREDSGPAGARNVGVTLAQGEILAFTDSDCVPDPAWLRTLLLSLEPDVGIVQGQTGAPPGSRQPLFNHFVEVRGLDGTYCTANVCYRAMAVRTAGGFDPACDYWEDVDLGWRVRRLGWDARFASDARVFHHVMPMKPLGWLRHASRIYNLPVVVARYPEFRKHLFVGIWSDRTNILFEAAVAGLVLGAFKREFLLMMVPYLASFPFRKRLVGKAPPLRAAAHIARDAVSLGALLVGSVKHRRLVL